MESLEEESLKHNIQYFSPYIMPCKGFHYNFSRFEVINKDFLLKFGMILLFTIPNKLYARNYN